MINENLVRQVVRHVLEKLIAKGVLSTVNGEPPASLTPEPIAAKSLVSEKDILYLAGRGVKVIPVLPKTRITPLARDRMQQVGMTAQLISASESPVSGSSGAIVIVAPRCYETLVGRISETIRECGYQSHKISETIRTISELEALNARIAGQILDNEFAGAVIIDELDRRLYSQTSRIKGVSASIGRGAAEHDILYINQRSWGIAAAAHVIKEWLSSKTRVETKADKQM